MSVEIILHTCRQCEFFSLVSEQISVMSRRVLSVRKANSDFDRKGHLASVYSFQGTDCRDGNMLKDLLIHSLQLVPVIWAPETMLAELTTINHNASEALC
jgi:hypothetical protein